MENVSKYTSVYIIFVVVVAFHQFSYILIIELKLATLVGIDGCWREVRNAVELVLHYFVLDNYRCCQLHWLLSSLQCPLFNVEFALYQQLQHKAAHLACLCSLGGIVVEQRNVFGAL